MSSKGVVIAPCENFNSPFRYRTLIRFCTERRHPRPQPRQITSLFLRNSVYLFLRIQAESKFLSEGLNSFEFKRNMTTFSTAWILSDFLTSVICSVDFSTSASCASFKRWTEPLEEI